MADVLLDSFDTWMQQRPKWLQTAASRLISVQHDFSKEQISELADLAISEANKDPNAIFDDFPQNTFSANVSSEKLNLIKLHNVTGVNAICKNAAIDFKGDISVIYGQNGSGKSGFARLLKNMCGSKVSSDLLTNIYADNPEEPTASIEFIDDNSSLNIAWKIGDPSIENLRHVQIFDSDTAQNYITTSNEATYEPRRLRFLSQLIEVADNVSTELTRRSDLLPSVLPLQPQELSITETLSILKTLKSFTEEELRKNIEWTDADINKKTLIEAALKESDISAKIREIKLSKSSLKIFEEQIDKLKISLSLENREQIINYHTDAENKRRAASEDADKIFNNVALEGVGKESWKLMWEQARIYSEQVAYIENDFPNVQSNAICVLCHQHLDDNAKIRLSNFERYIKGVLESTAKIAEKALTDNVDQLPQSPNNEKWFIDTESINYPHGDSSELLSHINQNLSHLKSPKLQPEFFEIKWEIITNLIIDKKSILDQSEKTFSQLEVDGNRTQAEKELLELKAKEWLFLNKEAVIKESTRLRDVSKINAAVTLANTRTITQKKNELSENDLTTEYRNRFISELEALGGKRLPVGLEPLSKGKGKVNFSLILKNSKSKVKIEKILSEGESRIISLAAFLADMSGLDKSTPFIFDDPISSLDQDFEEKVVSRLVQLSKERQVIIFTHRLSFITLIEDAIQTVKRTTSTTTNIPQISLITLRRINDMVGLIDELDVRHKKPISGFQTIKDHKIPHAQKYLNEVPPLISEYNQSIKSICGDIRILTERIVEKTMFCEVIERFKRSVNTKQLKDVAKITLDDCSFIDNLMTKYSSYEHSQSDHLPGQLPELMEINIDVESIITWIKDFTGRQV